MSKDLNQLLGDWEYDAGGIAARWIQGDDGHPKVQLRVNLGLLQMEVKGRPDGQQPEGCSSLLEHYQNREEQDDDLIELDAEACMELQQEALQYYYRYLAFYALHYLDGVIEDTCHNLDLLDLVSQYATDDELAWQFLQFFPYVRMMNARARAEKLMQGEEFETALRAVEEALSDIEAFTTEYAGETASDTAQEKGILQDLKRRIEAQKPRSKEERLREELTEAIQEENYEQAALLRDELLKIASPKISMNGREPLL